MKLLIKKYKLLILIVLVVLGLYLTDVGCVFRFLLGISCPGCGLTRAVISALKLDFKMAFYYHPLFMLTPLLVIYILNDGHLPIKNKKLDKFIFYIVIGLFIGVYIYRLFIGSDVVSIGIDQSIIPKIIKKIRR